MSETTARADLLDLLAQWFLTTGKGSREHADRILNKHARELAERLRNVRIKWDAADMPAVCADLIDPEVATASQRIEAAGLEIPVELGQLRPRRGG